jgi:hypothetical protein
MGPRLLGRILGRDKSGMDQIKGTAQAKLGQSCLQRKRVASPWPRTSRVAVALGRGFVSSYRATRSRQPLLRPCFGLCGVGRTALMRSRRPRKRRHPLQTRPHSPPPGPVVVFLEVPSVKDMWPRVALAACSVRHLVLSISGQMALLACG